MTAKRPNLVLICTDQQHHASLHGRSRLRPRASADYIARDCRERWKRHFG